MKNKLLVAILIVWAFVFGSYIGHSIDQPEKPIKIGYPDYTFSEYLDSQEIAHDMTIGEYLKK